MRTTPLKFENMFRLIQNFFAVVKADSYGHGSVMLAPTLLASGFDMLGVASIDEGVDLRNAKITCDILVLGAVPVWAVESAVNADISIAVFQKSISKPANRLMKEPAGNLRFI